MRDDLKFSTSPIALSAAGVARRSAMKAQLLDVMQRRRRRRATLRTAVVAAAILLAATFWWQSQQQLALPALPTNGPDQLAMHGAVLEVVHNQPDRIAGFLVASGPLPPATWLSDEEMLDLAAQAKRPVGLIRAGDKCILTAKISTDSFE